ncbi:GMC family oxidoreductase [Inquilinus sp. CA228]|uniref:GMC family oxidoreductase n=1 Tax=Inquilinus sp. CA228 TaxID=3455609 RepID=UPI003F8D51C2
MADYIVVGGGSAGCVVASRLSEDPDVTVTLLEEGPSDISPYIHMPVAFYKTAQGNLLERYPWEPLPGHTGAANPTMVQPRVLGGGSSVNAMVYVRGQRADFDSWEASGGAGWGYDAVMRHFRKCESNDRFCNQFHGVEGPLAVSDQRFTHPLSKVWLQACQQAGLPWNPDFNAGDQFGCGLYQITARRGRRSSAAVAYLKPARKRQNLQVRTRCRVLRILFEGRRAVGVEYLDRRRLRSLRADREVVVSAGAINSPKLLMLSGIGPAEDLRSHGIAVLHDLPGVGRNLQDHVEVSMLSELNSAFSYDRYKNWHRQLAAGLQYILFGSGPVTANIVEGGAFWKTPLSEGRPDVQYCFMPGAGIDEGVDGVPGGNGCTVNVCQTRPKSVGHLKLRSGDPRDFPVIRPNYMQEQSDVDTMAEAIRFGREIMHQPVIARHIRREYVPAAPLNSLDEYRAFVRKEAHAALHPVGTCRIGTDEISVVDAKLRVRGVDGLRVADNSVAPNLISGNTNSIAIMIGEKAADLIRGEG